MESKTLTISNGEMTFEYECTKTIHTRVSEEVLQQLKTKDKVDSIKIITDVIVDELGLGEGNWQLIL